MATAFMKWLETTPRKYERGIHLLTLGRLKRLRDRILVGIAISKTVLPSWKSPKIVLPAEHAFCNARRMRLS